MSLVMVHYLHPKCTQDHVGLIPYMLDSADPTPAKDQFDRNYQHGGGWRNQKGFTLLEGNVLQYGSEYDPDDHETDPPLKPIAEIVMPGRKERIFVYDYSYVAIIQPDQSFEVCRMD